MRGDPETGWMESSSNEISGVSGGSEQADSSKQEGTKGETVLVFGGFSGIVEDSLISIDTGTAFFLLK